jgi:hypothetical protein
MVTPIVIFFGAIGLGFMVIGMFILAVKRKNKKR